jgi:hypothetical protein
MTNHPKRLRGSNQLAKSIVDQTYGPLQLGCHPEQGTI